MTDPYEHYRDPDQWGEPEPAPKRPRRRLSAMFSVRLTPDELSVVREAAAKSGLSVSAYLRRSALAAAAPMDVSKPGVQIRVLNATPGFGEVWTQ